MVGAVDNRFMGSTYDIRDFGAESGGDKDCSATFDAVLARIRQEGSGSILVPAGSFLTGPIELSDNTTLVIARGASLSFIDDPDRYPPVQTRWEGIVCHAMHPLVFARNARNVAIEGEGVIDGRGQAWWAAHRRKKADRQAGPVTPAEKRLAALNGTDSPMPSGGGGRETQFLRPPLIQFLSCEGIGVKGVTLRNSPFWTLHPVFSSRVHIEAVRIENPSDAPNTDGIDIDSCSDVSIVDCSIDVGDDCIALKAGSGSQGLAENRPSRNVSVSGCTFLNGHGGVVIGSETAGGIENVEVVNCRFLGSDRGIRLKSRRGRGGTVQNLSFRNLVMENVLAPITLNLYYNCGARPEEAARLFSLSGELVTSLTPRMRNIRIDNLVATGCRASAGFIVGLPESKIQNLVLENCLISMAGEGLVPVGRSEMYQGIDDGIDRGLRIENADCSLNNVWVDGRAL